MEIEKHNAVVWTAIMKQDLFERLIQSGQGYQSCIPSQVKRFLWSAEVSFAKAIEGKVKLIGNAGDGKAIVKTVDIKHEN